MPSPHIFTPGAAAVFSLEGDVAIDFNFKYSFLCEEDSDLSSFCDSLILV